MSVSQNQGNLGKVDVIGLFQLITDKELENIQLTPYSTSTSIAGLSYQDVLTFALICHRTSTVSLDKSMKYNP